MPVSFSNAGGSVIFTRAPQRPPRSLGFAQADVKSGGGERRGRDYYAKDDLIDLAWFNMPGADKAALLNFWQGPARGMANSFTYTDVAGSTAVCRFATPRLPEIRERAYDTFEVHTQLRVV